MTFVRLIPVVLSLLVLGAHFHRAGAMLPTLFCLALVFLQALPRAWVARVTQVALVLGTVEWLRTVLVLVRTRQLLGEPWTRAAVIVGAVAVITACSLLVFRNAAVRRRFGLSSGNAEDS